jgi:hypothetical protein
MKLYPASSCGGELFMQRKLVGIISVDFNPKGQLHIVNSVFVKYFRKNSIHEVNPSTSSQISEI